MTVLMKFLSEIDLFPKNVTWSIGLSFCNDVDTHMHAWVRLI